jgi:hypothetical protein
MDNSVLKKKLSTFRSPKGSFVRVPPEVLYELLCAWESWPGTLKDFYISIGVSHRQIAGLLGKAKRMKREGGFPASEFKEINVEAITGGGVMISNSTGAIEVAWDNGKVIRFPQVDQLVDFLKKAA